MVFGKIKYTGKQEDEPWYLLTNLPDLKSALKIYGQLSKIEAMFKKCKAGGYIAFEYSQEWVESMLSFVRNKK